jgi:hypothetical protein
MYREPLAVQCAQSSVMRTSPVSLVSRIVETAGHTGLGGRLLNAMSLLNFTSA